MLEKSSEKPFGERYLRYVRGLPAHPERAFGEHAEEWRYKEGDEVFTATRRTRDKVWRVIFELDDGGTFLRNGEGDLGNLMCISPLDPRGILMIRDSTVFSIDGKNFHGRATFFYEPDGRLNDVSTEFNRTQRGNSESIFGAVTHDLINLVRGSAHEEQMKKSKTVSCKTAHMDRGEFQLNFGVIPDKKIAHVRLERGREGFVSYSVPLHLEYLKDPIDYLRQKINSMAGEALM